MRNAISLALLCCSAAMASMEGQYTRDFQKTVALPAGRTLRIDTSFGKVDVVARAGNDVKIRASIHCQTDNASLAKSSAEQIQVRVEESNSGISIRTEYPKVFPAAGSAASGFSYAVDYYIEMPKTAPLEIRSRFGDITVQNLQADSVINGEYGKVGFTEGRGKVRIEHKFGEVVVRANEGPVTVVNGNEPVTASDVNGTLEITNGFADTRATNVNGGLTIRSQFGAVHVQHVTGVSSITTSFGPVTVSDARSDLTVKNERGSVEVVGVGGAADLRTDFAPVKFWRVGKSLTVHAENSEVTGDTVGEWAIVETTYGKVDLRGVKGYARVTTAGSPIKLVEIGGEVYAKTSHGEIEVEGAAGPITADNEGGPITATPKRGVRCHPIWLATRGFAPIRLVAPQGAGYNVTVTTKAGRYRAQTEAGAGAPAATHDSGAQGCDVRLKTDAGNIDVLYTANR